MVVLANLSGFDGSPESLRRLQLEYGAEIGRAIVNFDGPFVLCVVSRYHGGAFVVFSATLNDDMEVLAVEGSFASVIGGAPAAAVVFTRDVDQRTRADERVTALEARLADVDGADANVLRAELAATRDAVRNEKLGEVAAEFDADPQRRAGPGGGFGAPDHHRRALAAGADRRGRAGYRPRRCTTLPERGAGRRLTADPVPRRRAASAGHGGQLVEQRRQLHRVRPVPVVVGAGQFDVPGRAAASRPAGGPRRDGALRRARPTP